MIPPRRHVPVESSDRLVAIQIFATKPRLVASCPEDRRYCALVEALFSEVHRAPGRLVVVVVHQPSVMGVLAAQNGSPRRATQRGRDQGVPEGRPSGAHAESRVDRSKTFLFKS